MEAIQQTFRQFQQLLNGMAPSQRMTLVAVPLLVLIGLAGVVLMQLPSSESALLSGTQFTGDELKSAEEALRSAGLSGFRVDGGKILVERGDEKRYEAALLLGRSMPSQFGAEFDKVHEKAGMFAGERQREELAKYALQRELSKIIKAMNDVADASVMYDVSRRRVAFGAPKGTASVSVRMKTGREMTESFAHSIRLAVAAAVSDLPPEGVQVIDLNRGRAFSAPGENDVMTSQFLREQRQHTTEYEERIGKSLEYIPGVVVGVNVDLDPIRASGEREVKFDTKPFPVRTVEETELERSDETKPTGEPGFKSNQPVDVRTQPAAKQSRTTERTNNSTDNLPVSTRVMESQRAGLIPKTVKVSISIPDDYYKQVAQKKADPTNVAAFQAAIDTAKADTEKAVKATVLALIPTGSTLDNISVSSFVALDTPEVTMPTPYLEMMQDLLTRWTGPAALGAFAIWIMWSMSRSLKAAEAANAAAIAAASKATAEAAETAADAKTQPGEPDVAVAGTTAATRRDQLQSLVRDNPEVAASVIGKWVSAGARAA